MSNNNPIRVVFLGTPHFSVPTLEALMADQRFDVIGVITQPDKPTGRGQKLTPTPVKQRALSSAIPVFQPKSLRKNTDILTWLRNQSPHYLVTIAFGQILSQEVLDIPSNGTVNVHASLLPQLRGANPIQQAILSGQTETGITTMLTDIGVDTGDILLKTILPINRDETAGELAERMAQAGGPLLIETLLQHYSDQLQGIPQAHDDSTHAPKANKADAAIDWHEPAEILQRKIMAYNPSPGAYCQFDGQRFKILRASVAQAEQISDSEENLTPGQPGQICAMIKSGIVVATGKGNLLITALQPAGKKEMPANDWARNAVNTNEQPSFESLLEPV